MTISLKHVQWLTIDEVAKMWEPKLKDIPKELLARELKLGWYKWTRMKEGVEGFKCGTPLREYPPDDQLPPDNQQIDKEYLDRFAIEQDWPIPDGWLPKKPKDGSDRYPGRPSIKSAIVQELRGRAERGELKESLAKQADALQSWADANFRGQQVPKVKSIENQIRSEFRRLK